MDLCEAFRNSSCLNFNQLSKHVEFLFLDDFSGMIKLFPITSKALVASKLTEFDQQIYNQHGYHINFIRSDNATENRSQAIVSYCRKHGIIQQLIVPYNSSQNKEERSFERNPLNASTHQHSSPPLAIRSKMFCIHS